ncbi:MAG: hypothetical protein NC548_38150 [Lachnospiraceae bacterium]|nr:hypothetical protein [Lachnospiraceae bacterium]
MKYQNHCNILITKELRDILAKMRETMPTSGKKKQATYSDVIFFLLQKNK